MAKVKKMAMGGIGVPYNTRGNSTPSMMRTPFNTAGNSAPSMLSDPRSGRFNTLGMAKGGAASARADGCCTKGKTKGRFV